MYKAMSRPARSLGDLSDDWLDTGPHTGTSPEANAREAGHRDRNGGQRNAVGFKAARRLDRPFNGRVR